MKDSVTLKYTGEAVDLVCEVYPEHKDYVSVKNGVKFFYVKLDKAIYRCVTSALLWYNVYSNNLKDIGFTINPYDPCVANCEIEGLQCTVVWYVDDMNISHINPDVVSSIMNKTEDTFRKMTVAHSVVTKLFYVATLKHAWTYSLQLVFSA